MHRLTRTHRNWMKIRFVLTALCFRSAVFAPLMKSASKIPARMCITSTAHRLVYQKWKIIHACTNDRKKCKENVRRKAPTTASAPKTPSCKRCDSHFLMVSNRKRPNIDPSQLHNSRARAHSQRKQCYLFHPQSSHAEYYVILAWFRRVRASFGSRCHSG